MRLYRAHLRRTLKINALINLQRVGSIITTTNSLPHTSTKRLIYIGKIGRDTSGPSLASVRICRRARVQKSYASAPDSSRRSQCRRRTWSSDKATCWKSLRLQREGCERWAPIALPPNVFLWHVFYRCTDLKFNIRNLQKKILTLYRQVELYQH